MERILVKDVEVQFNDLSEKMQEKLYLERKAEFEKEAAGSQYAKIRRMLIMDESTNSDTLDEIFKVEIEAGGKSENLLKMWNHPNFQKTDEKRKVFAKSDDWKIRKMAAEDEGSSAEFLNQMLQDEIQNADCEDLDVIYAIINNPNFRMDEETRKILAKSDEWEHRRIAAEDAESSTEFLNQMLQNEIQNAACKDLDVIKAIINNPNFKMDKVTREKLAKSNELEHRIIAAEDEGSSAEFLKQMLRDEIQGNEDCEVIEAIINNPNFKTDEGAREMLAKSDDWEHRIIAAKDEGSSKEFLENMFLKERDADVLEEIELNLLSKISKQSVTLNVVQERKILNVLKKVKKDKTKQPLAKYLKEIIDIIG